MTSTFRSAASLASASLALLAIFPFAAQAQTLATAVPVPAMDCENPGSAPLDKASPQMGRFTKKVDDYKTCVNAYSKATGAKSNEYADQAKAYNEAANKAIEEYNAYVTKLNESTKSDKSGTTKN